MVLVIIASSRRGALMTVATPPRPPGANITDDPGDLEALEALIEEARKRARRRRRCYGAFVLVAATGALAYFGFANAGGGGPPPPPVAEGGAEVAAPAGYIAQANARLITQPKILHTN
jgi:hypothetical protein